jgi:hypothetical protein
MRRVGMLVNGPETDAMMMARVAAFRKGLNELGWTSANSRIDIRYGVDDDELSTSSLLPLLTRAATDEMSS